MEKTRELMKRLLMLLMAAVFVLCGATVAFADESSETENMMLEESKAEEDFTTVSAPIDYSVLERQITIAIGLNKQDYTSESWDTLRKALDNGISLLDNAENQQEVIDAAEELELAVSSLARIDYSQLEKTLGLIYGKLDENEEIHSVLGKVDSAVDKAKKALSSGDQAAVDEATAELNALLEELSNIKTGEGETIIKEIEVQVPPSDDYCNIAGHKVWPVLFILSVVLNIALVMLIGYILSKMKNSQDDIPLVQYDIDDDIDDLEEYDDFDDYPEESDDEDTEEAFADGSEDGED